MSNSDGKQWPCIIERTFYLEIPYREKMEENEVVYTCVITESKWNLKHLYTSETFSFGIKTLKSAARAYIMVCNDGEFPRIKPS